MNPRERVLTTINHKEPDRVPLFFNALDAKFVRAIGQGDMVETWKRLGVDVFVTGRTTWCGGKPSGLGYSPIPHPPEESLEGAPVNEKFAQDIGADGYASDAASAVDVVKSMVAQ